MDILDCIEPGDIVAVNFNNACVTLTKRAEVIYKPCAYRDCWIIKDLDCKTPMIHYISEGCTVSLIEKRK